MHDCIVVNKLHVMYKYTNFTVLMSMHKLIIIKIINIHAHIQVDFHYEWITYTVCRYIAQTILQVDF